MSPAAYQEENMKKEEKIKRRLKDRIPKLAIKIFLIVVAIMASIAISLMYPQVRTTLANVDFQII